MLELLEATQLDDGALNVPASSTLGQKSVHLHYTFWPLPQSRQWFSRGFACPVQKNNWSLESRPLGNELSTLVANRPRYQLVCYGEVEKNYSSNILAVKPGPPPAMAKRCIPDFV